MGSNVPIFLSIVNKFHYFIMNFDRPTSIIAFGGKMKIVTFFKQLDFQMVPLKTGCKIHRHYYSRRSKLSIPNLTNILVNQHDIYHIYYNVRKIMSSDFTIWFYAKDNLA